MVSAHAKRATVVGRAGAPPHVYVSEGASKNAGAPAPALKPQLHVVQLRVNTARRDQRFMRSLLLDAVIGQDDDPVRLSDG